MAAAGRKHLRTAKTKRSRKNTLLNVFPDPRQTLNSDLQDGTGNKGCEMPRSSIRSAVVARVLLALGQAPATSSEELPDLTSIGFVVYTKSHSPGTLIARWLFTDQYKGSG